MSDPIVAIQFADQLGFQMEATGHPRLVGRVLGWLLACDPPHQSAQGIATALSVSRSAISPVTQVLIRNGLIEQVQVPGSRETHFAISETSWIRMQQASLQSLSELRRIAARALSQLADRDPALNHRLQAFHDFHLFIEREAPALLLRWEEEQAKRKQERPT